MSAETAFEKAFRQIMGGSTMTMMEELRAEYFNQTGLVSNESEVSRACDGSIASRERESTIQSPWLTLGREPFTNKVIGGHTPTFSGAISGGSAFTGQLKIEGRNPINPKNESVRDRLQRETDDWLRGVLDPPGG